MSRVQWTETEWSDELAYIVGKCSRPCVPENMNLNPDTWVEYIRMQASFARIDGYPHIAGAMEAAVCRWQASRP